MNSIPLPRNPSEQEIQPVAYQLWQEQGKPAGHDLEIWLTAQERLRHRVALPLTHVPASHAPTPTRNAQAAVRKRR